MPEPFSPLTVPVTKCSLSSFQLLCTLPPMWVKTSRQGPSWQERQSHEIASHFYFWGKETLWSGPFVPLLVYSVPTNFLFWSSFFHIAVSPKSVRTLGHPLIFRDSNKQGWAVECWPHGRQQPSSWGTSGWPESPPAPFSSSRKECGSGLWEGCGRHTIHSVDFPSLFPRSKQGLLPLTS